MYFVSCFDDSLLRKLPLFDNPDDCGEVDCLLGLESVCDVPSLPDKRNGDVLLRIGENLSHGDDNDELRDKCENCLRGEVTSPGENDLPTGEPAVTSQVCGILSKIFLISTTSGERPLSHAFATSGSSPEIFRSLTRSFNFALISSGLGALFLFACGIPEREDDDTTIFGTS